MTDLAMTRSAVISECGAYRYRLERRWGDAPMAVFIMLNPSTADADLDDPTIRKCMGFAHRWGLGGIVVGNLFAYRATDPKAMLGAGAPVGPENVHHLKAMCDEACFEWPCGITYKRGMLICAWGAHGSHMGQDRAFLDMCAGLGARPQALRLTKSGHPGHPLYIPYDSQRVAL